MNPFLGYGAIVTGERLVGRSKELEWVKTRLFAGSGSLSVIGEPRIGKSSIVNSVAEWLTQEAKIPVVWIDMSTLPGSLEMFKEITWGVIEAAQQCRTASDLHRLRESFREPTSAYEAYRQCRQCLISLNRAGVRQVVVLDEFDAIRGFEDASVTIQRLRDLSYRKFETGLSAVFVSRRTLRNIEQQVADVSNLDNVCEQYCVRPFDGGGLAEMALRCADEWVVSEDDLNSLNWHTGGHPYLSEMILCNGLPSRSIHAGSAMSIASILEYYQHLERLLAEDALFEQLLQLVVGPRWSVRSGSHEILQRYGIVTQGSGPEGARPAAWSEHFQGYLEMRAREGDSWALWRETERAMRSCIEAVCTEAHGPTWIKDLSNKHPSVLKVMNECATRQERERKNFGFAEKLGILEYSYPMDLWCIIGVEWTHFQNVLKKDKKYWSDRFAHLSKIRIPSAHSREIVIPDHEIALAHAYCKEILAILQQKP